MPDLGTNAVAEQSSDRLARRLSPEELSILSLESETVAGHACKVMVLADRIDPLRLRETIGERLARAPELSMRLGEVEGVPCWTPDPDFDLAAHVVAHDAGEAPDGPGLRAAVAHLFEQRLDRSRPLWRMDVIPELAGGGSAVIWRIHHALADGWTAMRMASAVLWQEQPEGGPPSDRSRRRGRRRRATGAAGPEGAAGAEGGSILFAAAREVPQPWHPSPFDGRICAQRSVAFASVELDGLRRVSGTVDGATVNDAVLTVVAGGLRRWLEAHHGHLGPIRVKVPVSLHDMPSADGPGGAEPGNRDSFFCLDLPLDSAEPVTRLATIRRATRARKRGHDAQHVDALMRELGHASPRLRRFAEHVLGHPRSFALNVSNVPGPPRPVHVVGIPVRSLHTLAEIGERHALRIAVVSFAETLNFGLCADPTVVHDVDQMAAHMQAEAAALVSYGGA